MKRTGFKFKPRKPLARRSKLRVSGHSSTSELKIEIQEVLRQICLYRDGGCILRNYTEAGNCGGRDKKDNLILQAEHLVSRAKTSTFADSRNTVCLCRNHHIFFKPQNGSLYWNLIRRHLGEEKWKWFERVRDDWMPHKVDLKLELLALRKELELYNKN